MSDPDVLSDPLLDQLYKEPWLVRRHPDGARQYFRDKSDVDLKEIFLDYYALQTGEFGERLDGEAAPSVSGIKERVAKNQMSFPDFTCITEEAPAAHHSRANRSFDVPAVETHVMEGEAFLSLNYDIPVVARRSEGRLAVVPSISSGHFAVLNIKGGARIFEKNQLILESVYCFNDHFGANNFAHWLLDWVPRLKFLVEDPQLKRHSLIFGMPMNRVQRQVLSALKIDANRVIQVKKGSLEAPVTFAVANLVGCNIAGPALRRPAQACSPWALEFIRGIFLKGRPSGKRKRLLINRRGTRKLLISDATRYYLERAGFQEILLESQPLADQARMFNDAEIIISAHGAALSNLVFCEPGTRILEIFPQNYSTSNFFALASASGLDYVCAVGISQKSPLGNHLRDFDIVVDDAIIHGFMAG